MTNNLIENIDPKELVFFTFEKNKILMINDKVNIFVPDIKNPEYSYFQKVNITTITEIGNTKFKKTLVFFTNPVLKVLMKDIDVTTKFIYKRDDYKLTWFSINDIIDNIDVEKHFELINKKYNLIYNIRDIKLVTEKY